MRTPIAESKPTKAPLRARWFLAVKKDTGKAKARLVVLGFQDADLGHVRTEALTASKRARSMYLQKAANELWLMSKADAEGAFLQGKTLDREVSMHPVPDLQGLTTCSPGRSCC